MNLFSAIELGKNSILTHQQVFNVIGHNIANVNTEGYSRQVIDLENVRPSVIGLKDGGRGVNLIGIRSIRDRFIDSQLVERRQYQGRYDTMSGIMKTIETLFDESSGLGLSDALTNFFNGWADVANQPTDIATRSSLVSKSQSFTNAMNNTYQRLIDQQEVNDSNIGVMVDEINTIADEIAVLNEKIAYAEGSGVPANDLLDTRERRIRELSEKVGINFYYEQSNHSATIEIGGRPLVSFNQVNSLSVQRNTYNSNYYDVYMDQYGVPAYNITTSVTGGELSSLIETRDGKVVNGAGQVTGSASAGGFTTLQFSQAHGLSVGDLVTIGNQTRSVVSIPGTAQIVVADFNPAITTPTSWQRREGYIPEYKKQLDKMAAGLVYNVNNLHQSGYGLNEAAAPDRNFFQMSTQPAGITSSVNAAGDTVTFTANVSSYVSVGDVISINGETRLVISYNPATFQAGVNPPFSGPSAAGTSWEYYNIKGAAARLEVNPTIAADPSLVAASSLPTAGVGGAVGNNDIALSISRLLDNNSVIDSDNDGVSDYGTFHEYLHSMFSEIGNAGNTATYESESNGAMLNYLENRRDSISAVSLDEEAATLMQFEKSYQSLAQFMSKISALTDILMDIV